jgi:hypothetical protein
MTSTQTHSVHYKTVGEADADEHEFEFIQTEVDFEEGLDAQVEHVQTYEIDARKQGEDREDLDHGSYFC